VRSLSQAERLWSVRDVRDLPHEVRGAIVDVFGHEAAERSRRGGTVNAYGAELDDLPSQ